LSDCMACGTTRNLLDHHDEKFILGKTIINRRNLQEQPADFLFDAGQRWSDDEIDGKPVRPNPVEGYPGIRQTGDQEQQVADCPVGQRSAISRESEGEVTE